MHITTLLMTILLATFGVAVEVGMTIPAPLSSHNNNDLLTDINLIHQEIYSLDPGKDEKKWEKLQGKLKKVLDSYLINNSCLRYYLSEYVMFEDAVASSEGLMIAFNIEFASSLDSKIQKLNLSVLDKNVNVLRRINNIDQKTLKMLINYPITSKSEVVFDSEYFDLCFENVKHDKSWNSRAVEVDANIGINFGIGEISSTYQQSTKQIYDAQKVLEKIEGEVDFIVEQLLNNLKTSEPELRNRNEDTLEKFVRLFVFTCVVFVVVSFSQAMWLIKYLKKHGLM